MRKNLAILSVLVLSCSSAGAEVNTVLDQNTETEINRDGLSISYIDKKGNIQTEALSDKPTLIIFWADYCPTCIRELPIINARIKELEVKFDVLALAHSERDPTNKFIEDNMINNLRVGFSTKEMRETYGIIGQPITLILDTKGEVQFKFFGPLSFEELLNF
ncbi:MAG: TlpA disulfide reductase family protein [Actinomycetota bacterium]|nr:TlpA disulfide reductase family protein [Actinomycetota bacterium]|tara:strand:- start:86 stop:571 length:486 start_codon:yes stop_codon:yes gene_type:complete